MNIHIVINTHQQETYTCILSIKKRQNKGKEGEFIGWEIGFFSPYHIDAIFKASHSASCHKSTIAALMWILYIALNLPSIQTIFKVALFLFVYRPYFF